MRGYRLIIGIKNPKINPHFYGQLIIDKSTRKFNGGKNNLSKNSLGQQDIHM